MEIKELLEQLELATKEEVVEIKEEIDFPEPRDPFADAKNALEALGAKDITIEQLTPGEDKYIIKVGAVENDVVWELDLVRGIANTLEAAINNMF